MGTIRQWQLRAQFARRLSRLYGEEVPAYQTLVEVSTQVNADYQAAHPWEAERFGSLERVTAERHGAIRVGGIHELAQAARVFGAVGMHPVGFYDLREANPPIPVVSTAFRPVKRAELARNPFRVFTSMLVADDRRFFNAELQARLEEFIGSRRLFPDELLTLADRSIKDEGLDSSEAERFLDLAAGSFALSSEPVDRAWYETLEAISSVASDIGGVPSTHINHLTPRVLDIDDLYARMQARGVTMIDTIQGPPRWDGPAVLLRQTSFRALDEPRRFVEPDGRFTTGDLRVRFGEVEARGLALTPVGRDLYDRLLEEIDRRVAVSDAAAPDVARSVWEERMPATDRGMFEKDYAYFNIALVDVSSSKADDADDLMTLVDSGAVAIEPIVYEDFLPRSAAGIFASNLAGTGSVESGREATRRDFAWMAGHIGVAMYDPFELYAAERQASFEASMDGLGLDAARVRTPWSDHE